MRKNKTLIIFFAVFAVSGIIMLITSFWQLAEGIRFQKKAVEVTGKIVDIVSYKASDGDMSYAVYVTYTYEGKTYEKIRLGGYSSSMFVGKSISLLCDPENPDKVQTASDLWVVVIVLMLMGIVFSCVGIIPAVLVAKRRKREKRLIAEGIVLNAIVVNIDMNRSLSVNRRHPYIIECIWRDEYSDVTYRFRSGNLWTDPGIYFDIGSQINVYADRNDYSKYYVDAESVLSQKVVDYT